MGGRKALSPCGIISVWGEATPTEASLLCLHSSHLTAYQSFQILGPT